MARRGLALATACAAAALLMPLGCGTSGNSPRPSPQDEGTLNDWKKIIEVSDEGGLTVRRHVGYLNRQYTESDPEGIMFVLDARLNRLGFLLPTGQAYAYVVDRQEIKDKRDLGNLGFDNGVRNVLGITGTLEYEPVSEMDVPRTGNS